MSRPTETEQFLKLMEAHPDDFEPCGVEEAAAFFKKIREEREQRRRADNKAAPPKRAPVKSK